MENEIMNDVMDVAEEMGNDFILEEVTDITIAEPEPSSNPIKGLLIIGGIVAGALLIKNLIKKNKGKFTEWEIKRLEKKGYKVILDQEDVAQCDECVEEVEGFDE